MYLYRNIIEEMIGEGINHFILIGENVHAFHADDSSYYEEWMDQMENGWIVGMNFLEHNMQEIQQANLDRYVIFDDAINIINWRTFAPNKLFQEIDDIINEI